MGPAIRTGFAVAVLLTITSQAQAQSTVRRGDEGRDVRQLQELLKARGANVTVDGKFGATTETAVKEIQRSASLVADGVAGPTTWRVLAPTSAPLSSERKLELASPRMEGNDVKLAQDLLNKAGYSVPTDGVYGTGTVAAVKRFQTQRRLRSDGKIGIDTWRALKG